MRKRIFVFLVSLCLAAGAYAQCELLNYDTESVPLFVLNEPANFQLEVSGGTAPYHFELVAGSLPEGLHLSASGRIVGRPTQTTFDTTAFVQVTDAQGCTLTQAFALYVEPVP